MNRQWHEFIFSEERKSTILRHLAFWLSWWFYFLGCYFLLQQPIPDLNLRPYFLTPGQHLPLKTFLLVMLFAIACYPLIYTIFPELTKGKWLKAVAYFIVICVFLVIASHVLFWNIFSFIDAYFGSARTNITGTMFWPSVSLGVLNFTKVATAAIAVKYVKYWWLKQKETQRLEKEKLSTELQLLKAQIHPDFLFKTLNNIYTHALTSSPQTSGMLLRLSDILSYMLYECDLLSVPLEKEIQMMKEYMQLEKISQHDQPEMEINVKGRLSGKQIAPFLLLPFIQNSFEHSSRVTEQFWINLDIRLEGNKFSMKLSNAISEKIHDQALPVSNALANVQKRLTFLYPGKHDLKITSEQEMLIVLLNIQLDEIEVNGFENDGKSREILEPETSIESI